MADIRTIGIQFDPKPAKQGAEAAKKAVHDMATSVDHDLQKVEQAGKETGQAVAAAGDKIEKGAKKADNALDRLGKNNGMSRMGQNARASVGAVSNGVVDLLDTFGLLDNGMGMMVRRVQSGINSVGNLSRVFGAGKGNIAAAGATAKGTAAALGEVGTAGASAAGGIGEAAAGMGSLGAMAAVALPVLVALAAALVGLAGIGAVFMALKAGIPKAAAFEEAETGLAVLLGGFDKASQKMADIKKFAAATPFESAELIQGARYLETFTSGLMNNEKGWTLVGDAAAAAQRDFGEVAMWTGRMYAALKGGQPIGEATMRLMEMGLITPQVKGKMDALAESSNEGGKNFAQVWGIAEGALKRFTGTMALQSTTWNGLMSSLSDNWNLALAAFAAPVMDSLKPLLTQAVGLMASLIPLAQSFGQALANGVTATIQIFQSGQIEQALKLGFWAAFEFARATFVTMMLMAFETVMGFLMQGMVDAITLPIRMFSTLMGAAIDFVGKLLQGDLTGAMAVVMKYFGDGGVSAIKMMGAMVYNSLGQAFTDVVNSFSKAIYGVLQKAGNLASTVMAKAGQDPLSPSFGMAPPPMKFTPMDTSFGAVKMAADKSVGTGAREDFAAFIDKMVADGKKAQGPKPAVPAATSMEGMTGAADKKGGKEKVEKIAKALEYQGTQLEQLAQQWGDLDKQIDATATGSMQAIAGGMTDALTSMAMGTKDAATAFRDMATSIVSDILRMINQMLIQLALSQALRAMGVTPLVTAHSGGTVGATNLPSGGRMSLPTYHSGGMATSEQAVKVERGESILTRKRAKELEMELAAQRGERPQGRGQGQGGNEATIINVFDRNEIADAVVARPDAVVNAISRSLPAVRKMVMSGNRI